MHGFYLILIRDLVLARNDWLLGVVLKPYSSMRKWSKVSLGRAKLDRDPGPASSRT